MKYIIQVNKGEINGHWEKEGLPTEYQYEFEQEMLKHVHDLKNDLREKGWWERETPEVSQTSFLRSENSDAELGFKFEWRLTWKLSLILIYNCHCFYQPEVRTPVKSKFQLIDITPLFFNSGVRTGVW